jgi:hypothetical protein
MQRLFSMAWLTWKAAFRYRLFWVLLVLLIALVTALPLLIKHDGSARGFAQILLTYTLSVITIVLGFSTLWLGCGTLARDIEEAQMQVVATKPIARWQIWLGKWLGILFLNAVLLAISGGCVFFLLQWRARQLPAEQQKALRNEVLVARASLKEPPVEIASFVEKAFAEFKKSNPVNPTEEPLVRKQIEERFKAEHQIVRPNFLRRWTIDFGPAAKRLRDQPVYVRAKFYVAQTNTAGTYRAVWQIGPPETPRVYREEMSLAANTFYEFAIPPNLFDADGKLTIDFMNWNDTAVLFSLEDGLEVLYRESGFGLNFMRGLGIILCWLSLLAAIGLTAATFLSFPTAAFFSLTILIVGLSSGTLNRVVEEGTALSTNHETAEVPSLFDRALVTVFAGMLKVINLVQGFSPVDALSSGRSITWGQLGLAFAQVVLLLGGMFAGAGMIIFNRRELATAQSTT